MLDNKIKNLIASLEEVATFDDDEVLSLTRAVRLNAVKKLTVNGIPTSLEDFEMLHKNLAELDKQALGNKRLAQDGKQMEMSAAFFNTMMESIQRNTGTRDVFVNAAAPAVLPNPEHEIEGTANIIDGELNVGVEELTYEKFMANEGRAIEEAIRQRAEEEFNR